MEYINQLRGFHSDNSVCIVNRFCLICSIVFNSSPLLGVCSDGGAITLIRCIAGAVLAADAAVVWTDGVPAIDVGTEGGIFSGLTARCTV